jgi:hypothetical protein
MERGGGHGPRVERRNAFSCFRSDDTFRKASQVTGARTLSPQPLWVLCAVLTLPHSEQEVLWAKFGNITQTKIIDIRNNDTESYELQFLRAFTTVWTKIQVKVKLSLCFTKYHTMKAYWGVEV